MNKIFKVIWSKTKNCYVVTSELAKSHTKAPSKKGISRVLVCGVLACVLSGSFVMPVANAYFTQYPGDISVINIDDQYFNPDTDNNTALEWDLGRSDNGNIEYSIGVHSYALKIGNVLTGEAGLADATDIYDNMHVSNGNFINANNSVAQNLTALDNAIARISGSSLINNSSAYLSDGYFALADTNGVYFADISGDLNDALNELYYASEFEEGDQYSGLIQNNSIGFKALKDKNGNVIFKGGINYRSFGNLPDAMKTVTLSGEKAVEFGIVTQAELDTLKAKGNIDFAVEGGYASQAVGYGSTALGIGATALGDGNIAIGNNAGAVLGKTVGGINNGFNYVIAEPDQMAVSDKVNNISIGKDSFADGNNGIAIGTRSWAVSDDSVAIGRGAVGNAGGIAIGKNSYSVKSGNIALGDGALADSGNFSMLLSGDDQPVHGNVALGADSVAPDDDNNVVSVGAAVGDKVVSEISGNVKTVTADKAFTRRIINVSEGIDDSDAVTVSQLNAAIADAGGSTPYVGINSATGGGNEDGSGAVGTDFIAIGKNAGVVLGTSVGGLGGTYQVTAADVTAASSSNSAVAIGNSATTLGSNSIAIGNSAFSTGGVSLGKGAFSTNGVALGNDSLSIGKSVALGNRAFAGSNNATNAIGSVAIGYNSFVGTNEDGVVSFGRSPNAVIANELSGDEFTNSEQVTRRLINVSRGIDDTDVVNVGQLNDALADINSGNSLDNLVEGDHIEIANNSLDDTVMISVVNDGEVEQGDSGLVTGGQVHTAIQNETRPSSNGNYVLMNISAADNLLALDEAIKANADAIDAIEIPEANVYTAGDGIAIDASNEISVNKDGEIESGNEGIVTGGQVYDAIQAIEIPEAEPVKFLGVNSTDTSDSNYDGSGAEGIRAIALGVSASATGTDSVAIGTNSSATRTDEVSIGSSDIKRYLSNVANGTLANDATNVAQTGSDLSVSENYLRLKNSLGEDLATVALSDLDTHVVTNNYITVNASDGGEVTLTINNLDVANDDAITNVGTSTVTGENSTALGTGSTITGVDSIAVGTGHQVSGSHSGAFGDPNIVDGSNSYVIGNNSSVNDVDTDSSFVIGNNSRTNTSNTVILGNDNNVGGGATGSWGNFTQESGDTNSVVGQHNRVAGYSNNVIGSSNQLLGSAYRMTSDEDRPFYSEPYNNTNILGNSNEIKGNENTVLGNGITYTGDNAVIIGNDSAGVEDAVSVGNATTQRQIKYVATGTDDTDAVNVSQLNDAIAGIGSGGTHYLGINTTSTTDANYNGDTAVGLNSISIGRAGFDTGAIDKVAGALKENSISIGNGTTAGGVSAIAIGTGAIGGKNSSVAKDYSIAIGRDAKASIDRYATPVWTSGSGTPLTSNKKGSAIALGSEAEAENMNSIAIGYDTSSKGTNSIMIGMTGRANGADSIGIGTSVQADASNSVSIGANSASRTSGGVSIGSGAINNGGVAIGNEAYAGSVGVVSFGHKAGDPAKSGTYSSAKTVRVINVADGVETHDVSTVEQTGSALELTGSTLKLKSIVGDLSQVDLSNLTGSTYTAGNHISIGNDNSIAAVVDGTVSSGNTGLVNGGQVYDAIQTIRPNVYIAGNGIVINGDDNSVSVKNVIMYDSDSQDTATLNGTRGTKLTNLKAASLLNGSTDAVVGHQLWQTNENIRGFAQDIQTNSTNITNLTTSVTNALSSVSAISTTVDAINDVKADASLNNLTDTGRQVIASAAANAVQEYMAANSNSGVTGNGLLGTTNTLSTPRAMGFGLMANPMSNDNDDIITNNDDLNDNNDNTISQAVQDALDTKVEISDFNTALDLKADKDSVYSKDEVDVKFDTKADISYVDNQLGSKADLSYVDAEFGKKADKDSVYTKDEADTLLDAKADKAMLDEKANKDASNIEVEDWAKVLGIGEVTEGNINLVNGGTVYNALQNAKSNDLMAVDNNAIRIGGNAKYDDVRTIDVSTASGEGRVITGVVVNPEDATSVANVGYVNAIGENIIAGVTEGFRRVDDKISDVGANAAAMSALMPAGDDADKKWSLSASVGHYDSSTAGAVGLFYKPSDNVILNVRGTVGSDENMLAGGVSVALDKGTVPGVSKAQLVRTVNAQAQRIEQLEEKDKQRDMEMEQLRREVLMMKQQNIKK